MNVDVTKPKYFQFNVNIDGIDYRTLKGKLEFIYEGVSYGFPTKIYKDRVEVEIPALQSIIKKRITETDNMECKLEIMGEGFHLEPWKSEINIERSAYIDTNSPIVEDTSMTENTDDLFDNNEENIKNKKLLLDEDVAYLQKLKKQLDISNNVDKKILVEQKINKSNVNNKFDKKRFILEASKIEAEAVKNNIPLSETSKNDNSEQLRIRKKIRKIFQDAHDRKNNKCDDTNTNDNKEEKNKSNEKTKTFDINNINENEINLNTVIMMMESVGMTSDKTHQRFIEHAKAKGAETDVEIFDIIKQMLYPQQNTITEQQQMQFFQNRQ